jgi:hypothetical protein
MINWAQFEGSLKLYIFLSSFFLPNKTTSRLSQDGHCFSPFFPKIRQSRPFLSDPATMMIYLGEIGSASGKITYFAILTLSYFVAKHVGGYFDAKFEMAKYLGVSDSVDPLPKEWADLVITSLTHFSLSWSAKQMKS